MKSLFLALGLLSFLDTKPFKHIDEWSFYILLCDLHFQMPVNSCILMQCETPWNDLFSYEIGTENHADRS